jgi:hypothetical protein
LTVLPEQRLKGLYGAENKQRRTKESTEAGPLPVSSKRKLTRRPEKRSEDDPFVSDVGDDHAEEGRRQELQELKATSASGREEEKQVKMT